MQPYQSGYANVSIRLGNETIGGGVFQLTVTAPKGQGVCRAFLSFGGIGSGGYIQICYNCTRKTPALTTTCYNCKTRLIIPLKGVTARTCPQVQYSETESTQHQ